MQTTVIFLFWFSAFFVIAVFSTKTVFNESEKKNEQNAGTKRRKQNWIDSVGVLFSLPSSFYSICARLLTENKRWNSISLQSATRAIWHTAAAAAVCHTSIAKVTECRCQDKTISSQNDPFLSAKILSFVDRYDKKCKVRQVKIGRHSTSQQNKDRVSDVATSASFLSRFLPFKTI